ncbi:MAG: SrtB family sortase, partial [Firmicutes bacterium]|nr:SrtB family sortase [Bacillota bacterium]
MKTQKKHTGKSYMRIIGMMLCLAVFLFAFWNVLDIREEYREANETYKEAVMQFAEVPEPDVEAAGPDLPKIDFEGLIEINDDIVGWIYIEGTDVNYPILQGIDNDQYVFQSYKKKHLTAGSI